MGLRAGIYRSDYDSEMNRFCGKTDITIVNVEGPFEPTPDAPAAMVVEGAMGTTIIRPAYQDADGEWRAYPSQSSEGLFMDGGTYAATCDSRFRQAVPFYGAVPIHDRFETWAQYEVMSR